MCDRSTSVNDKQHMVDGSMACRSMYRVVMNSVAWALNSEYLRPEVISKLTVLLVSLLSLNNLYTSAP